VRPLAVDEAAALRKVELLGDARPEQPVGVRHKVDGADGAELAGFTLVTSGYRFGSLRGIVGVIGPTRMPYEKVIAIVDYTSSLVTSMLET